jgi:cytochrome c553
MKLPLCAIAVAGAFCLGTARADDAGALWTAKCAPCHGANGKGETKMGRKLKIVNLTDAKVQASFTDADATKAIKEGIKDEKGVARMQPVEDLSDGDVQALVAYVRALRK